MRKAFLISLVVVVCIVGTVAAYRHLRILPIDMERHAYTVPLTNVEAPDCRPELDAAGPDRTVILHAGPTISSVTINAESVALPTLQDVLGTIMRTRMNRVVYVLDAQDSDSLVLEKIVEQMPYVARICVIDSRHPPSWYPPKREPMGGAAGGFVAQAR